MASRSSVKRMTSKEYWRMVRSEYRKAHPGPFKMEDCVDWALKSDLLSLPRINARNVLLKQAAAAARAARIIDEQGRIVREMLPAKLPITVGDNGQMLLFEVVYDHIHTMSADHALMAFEQRDENMQKQKRAASRDLESFLDNNPNAKGCRERFLFEFNSEESETQQVVQKIPESRKKPNKPR